MDWAVDVLLDEEVVDGFDVLVFSGICSSDNSTNTNSIFIHQIDGLRRINHVAILSAEDVALIDFEVASCLLPAHLHSGVHDNVGLGVVLAGGFALVLPALLHGKRSQHLSQI